MNEFKSWEELTELEQLACEFSDFYKEANGFRPRHVDTSNWTVERFQSEFDTLSEICKSNALARKEEEAYKARKLETRISELLTMGAKDREMAIRWISEAEDAGGDMEYLCFLLGVEYGYFKNNP
jgi:hypothetical protein